MAFMCMAYIVVAPVGPGINPAKTEIIINYDIAKTGAKLEGPARLFLLYVVGRLGFRRHRWQGRSRESRRSAREQ